MSIALHFKLFIFIIDYFPNNCSNSCAVLGSDGRGASALIILPSRSRRMKRGLALERQERHHLAVDVRSVKRRRRIASLQAFPLLADSIKLLDKLLVAYVLVEIGYKLVVAVKSGTRYCIIDTTCLSNIG